MVREVARSQQLQEQVDEVREAFAIVQRVIEEGQAAGTFRPRRRRAARELGLLRRSRGGAHRLGARPAAGRRGGRRTRRADGDRARPRAARRSRLGRVKVFNLNGDEWDRVEDRPGWRSKDAWVGARIGAELIGGSMYELEPGDRLWPYHTHHANEEWMIVAARPADAAHARGRAGARRGRRRLLPARQGRAHQVRNATDAPIRVLMLSTLLAPGHRRVPGQRQSASGERRPAASGAMPSTGTARTDCRSPQCPRSGHCGSRV